MKKKIESLCYGAKGFGFGCARSEGFATRFLEKLVCKDPFVKVTAFSYFAIPFIFVGSQFWSVRCENFMVLFLFMLSLFSCHFLNFFSCFFRIRGSSLIYTKKHVKFHRGPWDVENLMGSVCLSGKRSSFYGFWFCSPCSFAIFLLIFRFRGSPYSLKNKTSWNFIKSCEMWKISWVLFV